MYDPLHMSPVYNAAGCESPELINLTCYIEAFITKIMMTLKRWYSKN
jgi:hypothetical protein